MGVVFHIYYLFYFIFIQDIYYTNCKEQNLKNDITKRKLKKNGKVLRTYNYIHFTIIYFIAKNSRTIAESGLFYKKLINT